AHGDAERQEPDRQLLADGAQREVVDVRPRLAHQAAERLESQMKDQPAEEPDACGHADSDEPLLDHDSEPSGFGWPASAIKSASMSRAMSWTARPWTSMRCSACS